jgi:isopentenyl diphosphate isomerase/L-lactate dehydrogenase-like FMN-dependent dehydrogenase
MKVPHRHDLRPGAQSISDPGGHSNATWRDIEWLRSITKIRLLLKGVLHPEDAELALKHEVDGIMVSNHGAKKSTPKANNRSSAKGLWNGWVGDSILVDGGISSRHRRPEEQCSRSDDAVLIGRRLCS